ncbi:MAG TPA: hypothetical protein DEG17_24745 [Cyanobacteria bacterium UBA11149]|nr:hypothetical protein [Cyanobacteria bacterium UBA11367]HBE59609.1 hypothetical protein [Cyanobacteria bacterium UBA11366]HBK65137.1 hypothetical protein [Cyanobacteria bacterium UBA11166]HBR75448.1 hypothetical protein [Cyanobacteria bacterium UBA11159]HBS70010.1 hypothetical protein [Cyanobacteria bacterium UBA11153]HBW91987.1 hypothetical protein [Cyanobacteria bacterium UBA11149]HCA94119.1 hypothetical protein [Cyanobacteria bacterium UBA9226]
MKTAKTLIVPKTDEIRKEGIKVIVERMGLAGAAFFLRETMAQSVDYLELKNQLFGNMTVADIYQEIKKSSS